MRVICPRCRNELDLPNEHVGRTVGCSHCGTVFTAHSDERDETDSLAEPPRTHRLDREEPPSRKSNVGVWGLVLLIAIVMTPCTGVGVWAFAKLLYPNFRPITDQEGRFEAQFPDTPTPITETNDDGLLIRGLEHQREFPPETYRIAYLDLPARQAKLGPVFLVAATLQFSDLVPPGAREIQRETVKHDGFDALDVRYTDEPGEFIVRYVYVPGPKTARIYMISWDGSGRPEDARVKRFFLSVQLKK